MSTRIPYDQNSPIGGMVSKYIENLADVFAQGERLKNILDSMSSGDDWAQIEAEINGMSPGDGESLYNIITAVHGQLDVAGFAQVYRLDKG